MKITKRNRIKRKYSKKRTKTRHSRKRVFSKKRRKTIKKKKRGGMGFSDLFGRKKKKAEKEKLEKEMLAKINELNEDKKNVSRVIDEMKNNLKKEYLAKFVLLNEEYVDNFLVGKFKAKVCKKISKEVINSYTTKLGIVLYKIKSLNNQINNKQSGGAGPIIRESPYGDGKGSSSYNPDDYSPNPNNTDKTDTNNNNPKENNSKIDNKENIKTEQELKEELEKEETEYNDTFSDIKKRIETNIELEIKKYNNKYLTAKKETK